MAQDASDKFLDHLLRKVLQTESMGAGVGKELTMALDKAEQELSSKISKIKGTTFTKTHLTKAQAEINATLKGLAEKYPKVLNEGRKEVIQNNFNDMQKQLMGLSGEATAKELLKSNFTLPTNVVKQIMRQPVGGQILENWISDHLGHIKSGIKKELTQSIIQAETMPQAAKRLEKTFDLSKRGANLIAKTSILEAGNAARDEVYKENKDFIVGYSWVATLDIRTCPVCGNLDGRTEKKRNELPPAPNHPLCRCVVRPITKLDESFKDDKGECN